MSTQNTGKTETTNKDTFGGKQPWTGSTNPGQGQKQQPGQNPSKGNNPK